MNIISSKRVKLKEILEVTSSENFHSFFFDVAIKNYSEKLNLKKNNGTVLALGANHNEAK